VKTVTFMGGPLDGRVRQYETMPVTVTQPVCFGADTPNSLYLYAVADGFGLWVAHEIQQRFWPWGGAEFGPPREHHDEWDREHTKAERQGRLDAFVRRFTDLMVEYPDVSINHDVGSYDGCEGFYFEVAHPSETWSSAVRVDINEIKWGDDD
jgi:hypothetical protein